MNTISIKTRKIFPNDCTLEALLDEYLPKLSERSVVAVTSKIVSICESRVILMNGTKGTDEPKEVNGEKDQSFDFAQGKKDDLIEEEAQWYLPRSENPYNVSLTITNNTLTPSAGIDESNGNGYFVLWPKDPQRSANEIWEKVRKIRGVREVGVVITDSKTTPLRWGVTGMALAHSGFLAINDYIGREDLFGRKFAYEKVNVMDSLAASAAFVMGEGAEQTPLALITDLPNVVFQDRNPTEEELGKIRITKEEDIYAPFLNAVSWKKGKK